MKKIIALFVFMLGVGFTANAQQKTAAKPAATATTATADKKEAAIQKGAENDTKALNDFIALTPQEKEAFRGLFEYKHRHLSEGLTDERKQLLGETIEAKINATLSAENVDKLSKNPTLLKKLTGKK